MIPTKDEIERIIKDHIVIKYMTIDPFTGHLTDPVVCGVSAAARAIAALLTPAHLMSYFVYPSLAQNIYYVPDSGETYCVRRRPDVTHCWRDGSPSDENDCSDSLDGTTCPHALAVELYLAREEQSTNA